jgi:hypothetical protein
MLHLQTVKEWKEFFYNLQSRFNNMYLYKYGEY